MRNDSPIRVRAHDRLERYPFAKQVAEGLIHGYQQEREALVVGIHGPWGSGKSSLINLLVKVIEQHYHQTEDALGIILKFNPWMFSGQQELQLIFLRELAARLYAKTEEAKQIAQQVSQLLGRLEALAKPITSLVPYYGGMVQQAIGFGKKATEQLGNPQDVESLKKKIDKALQESKIRLYITIDDIDRLTFAEIEHIFQLVKLNANFANTVFILAYDQEVVVNALDQKFAKRGQQYLEKIVQVDYGLPKVNRYTLKKLLKEQMGEMLEALDIAYKLDELIEEQPQLWEGIEAYIRTVRDINRYVNAVQLRLVGVWQTINLLDFMGLEVLRVFDIKGYEWIWKNKDALMARKLVSLREGLGTNKALTHSTRKMVNLLFDRVLEDNTIGEQPLRQRPLEKRIIHPESINHYFKLQH